MTSYDILAPLLLLSLGVAGVLWVRWAGTRLDKRIDAARQDAARKD